MKPKPDLDPSETRLELLPSGNLDARAIFHILYPGSPAFFSWYARHCNYVFVRGNPKTQYEISLETLGKVIRTASNFKAREAYALHGLDGLRILEHDPHHDFHIYPDDEE